MHTQNAKRRVWLAVGVLAMLAAPAHATSTPEYDKTLAKAIADKVSTKLGGLRDGFAPTEEPKFVPQENRYLIKIRETLELDGLKRIDPGTTGSVGEKHGALRPAPDRAVRVVYDGPVVR